jgi:chromosome segregation ATPase
MKEVQALRREIAPHLNFLKKQVEKVEKARAMREDLRDLYKTYFSAESTYISNEGNRIANSRQELDRKALFLDEKIAELEKTKNTLFIESENTKIIKEKESNLNEVRNKKDDLARSLGRIEGIIEGIERQFAKVPVTEERIIKEADWKSLVEELESRIDEAIKLEDLPSIITILQNVKSKLGEFTHSAKEENKEVLVLSENIEYQEMQNAKDDISKEIFKIKEEEASIINEINLLKDKEKESQSSLRDNERALYELLSNKNEIVSSIHSLGFQEEKLLNIKNAFEMEIAEGGVLIGREVIDYAKTKIEEEVIRSVQEDLRRKIERIKIKLEDSGSGNAGEIMKEYDDTAERDVFLGRELEDLNKSIDSLRLLIQELKETLDKEFKSGV